ncbi:MAG: LD-carboxypeptidase [Solobacterium sp.]|nr:LD-carboxypeptidase [Solobacterium sp.]
MIYPEFLKKNSTIGISAPSAGVGKKLDDFDASLSYLRAHSWKIRETESVRLNDVRGGDAPARGRELTSLFADPEVDFVLSAAGGDFLFECLPYVNWKVLKDHPKWLMGASDPTSLLYTLTTRYDIATLYGMNAGSFDAEPGTKYMEDALKIMQGRLIRQRSGKMYASKATFMDDYAGFDTPTVWLSNKKSIKESGRCIGGCIDVLKDLIGTKYDGTKAFLKRYRDDGIIWYFDNFAMSAENFYRTLLQMKYTGWFESTKAVIIGRVLFQSSETGMTYEDAVNMVFADIPYVFNADVGHTVPSFTMINGAVINLEYRNAKGSIAFELK